MTDLTKTFRALIKAKQISSETNLQLKKPTKKPEHLSTRFLSQAKLILSDINKLKIQLIECRTDYLSPSYLLSTKNRSMTDQQRIEFEERSENQIKQCRDDLEKLQKSIGKISFSGQRRTHYDLVCAYLERELIQCTKIYSEQKCLRYKRESERKKLGRLDHEEQKSLLTMTSTKLRQTSVETMDVLNEPTNSQPPTTTTITTTTFILDEENRTDQNETSTMELSQPTGQELRQLQEENNQLYVDVAQRSEEIVDVARQVVEISQLQNVLFDNIFGQKYLIENIDASASDSNDNMAAAILHIRDAVRNTSQMRRWIIFFLLVMTFSLLFLDWYNV